MEAAAALRHRRRRRAPSVRSSSPPPGSTAAAGPSWGSGGERTVRRLQLSRALTLREESMVSEACRRMAGIRADAVLLTDAGGLLSGILTDKDIATRVIAEGLRPERTIVSKIMTRNPVFVEADSLAIDALQMMIRGKFRHLPVLENGEVVAILDITKCLYDAISRMEKVVEQGTVVLSDVEGTEVPDESNFQASHDLDGTLKGHMFEPTLSTIIADSSRVATVSPSDPVCIAARRMREFRVNYVIIATGGKPQGLLTSKDILMRIVSRNLSPELTLVEKIMTPNPDCATLDTTVLDALHIMHDGKFLHLPVLDKNGHIAACVDVLQLTHAAIPIIEGGASSGSGTGNTIMQKFLDSAIAFEPPPDEQYDNYSDRSSLITSEYPDNTNLVYQPLGVGNLFAFKFLDSSGQMHRFNCGTDNIDELVSIVMHRLGNGIESHKVQLLYEDDEGDKILLTTNDDLIEAVNHARVVGSKVLKLHVVDSDAGAGAARSPKTDDGVLKEKGLVSLQMGVLTGAALLVGIGITVYLMRSKL